MRKPVLGLCALLAAGLTAGCVIQIPPQHHHEAAPVEQSISFEGCRGFATELKHANVNIRGWDQPTVAMDARVWARAHSPGAARELAEGAKVELERRGDQVVVECRPPRILIANEQVGIELTVQLPAEAGTQVATRFGDVGAAGIAGAIDLDLCYGNIKLRGAKGPVDCETTYGAIELEDAGAAVDCRSTYGNIKLRRAAGPVHCSTKYGGITVTEAQDTLECSTIYGNIQASFADGHWRGRPIKLKTTYGSVDLNLPTATDG